MLYIIYLVGGILIGFIVSTFVFINYIHYNTFGTIKQAHDDGETYLFLVLDKEPNAMKDRRRVVMKVDKNDFGPHE